MNNTLVTIIGLGTLLVIIVLYMVFKNKAKNRLNREKTDFLTQEIKNKLTKSNPIINPKSVEVNDLISFKKAPKNTNGIVNNGNVKTKQNLEVKKSNWVATNDYKEDIAKNTFEKIAKNKIEKINNEYTSSILLVDDSLVVRKYVGDLLKKNNYELTIKNDGWEALTHMNSTNHMPNIIITDIEMPNMDGIQLVESLRRLRKFNHIPILVISAHAASHLKLMEEEKIQGFIRKPFEDKDLINQVSYLIDNF